LSFRWQNDTLIRSARFVLYWRPLRPTRNIDQEIKTKPWKKLHCRLQQHSKKQSPPDSAAISSALLPQTNPDRETYHHLDNKKSRCSPFTRRPRYVLYILCSTSSTFDRSSTQNLSFPVPSWRKNKKLLLFSTSTFSEKKGESSKKTFPTQTVMIISCKSVSRRSRRVRKNADRDTKKNHARQEREKERERGRRRRRGTETHLVQTRVKRRFSFHQESDSRINSHAINQFRRWNVICSVVIQK
jgi:hypothetical protein